MLVPMLQVAREGTKKTVFTNYMELCKAMNRQPEHVQLFLLAELGTSGSLDGQSRLIVKGRFQPKAFEGVLRRYVNEYVFDTITGCTCGQPGTHQPVNHARVCDNCAIECGVFECKSKTGRQWFPPSLRHTVAPCRDLFTAKTWLADLHCRYTLLLSFFDVPVLVQVCALQQLQKPRYLAGQR